MSETTLLDPTATTSHDGAGYHGGSHNNGARDPIPDLKTVTAGLAQELIDRAAADTVLLGDITTEAASRASADTILQTNITAEATTRAAADTAEATTRAAADTALSGRVTVLEGLEETKTFLGASQQLTSNSTAMQNITGISLAMPIGSLWQFRGTILYNCTVTAKFKFDFTGSGTTTLFLETGAFTDAAGTPQNGVGLGIGGVITGQGSGATVAVHVRGTVLCGGTAGTLQLRAAQNVATVENTDFVVVGTNLIFTRLA